MLNLQQFIEDTDRDFDEKWYLHHLDEKYGSFTTVGEDVKQFIHSRLRALLEEVVGEVEGMKYNLKMKFNSEEAEDEAKGYNEALSSLATHLQEEILQFLGGIIRK